MGRVAEGWKLVSKPSGCYHVRFRVRGERYERSTKEREPGKASARAQVIYASAVAGKIASKPRRTNVGRPLDELCDDWVEGLHTSRVKGTVEGYFIYARHWIAHFPTLAAIDTGSAERYANRRLGVVLRKTVRKELSALRTFLEWCKESGELAEVPHIKTPPKTAVGRRYSATRKTEATDLSESEALAILAALPEKTRKWKGRYRRPRAFFTILWFTGLRPITVGSLRCPEHYAKGARELTITDEIDKARYGRKLSLLDETRAALDAVCPERGLLFPTRDYRETLKRAGAKAGLSPAKVRRLTAYDFRHARATDAVTGTGDLTGAAYMLGHKQITTTNRYLHASRRDGDRIVEALRARTPGAVPDRRTTAKEEM